MNHVVRWGIASGYMLLGERERRHFNSPRDEHKKALSIKAQWDQMSTKKLLTKEEIDMMRDEADSPAVLWVWIASYLGKLAEEGKLPNHGSTGFSSLVVTMKR